MQQTNKNQTRVKMGKAFSAVDLITVVVFAALIRILFLVFKTFGVVFPFNHSFMMLFSSFCLVSCLVVTRKKYAGVFFTIGWVCINFFLQGEVPHYFACIVLLPLLPEIYLAIRCKAFSNPDDIFTSTIDMIVYSVIYNVLYFVFNFVMIIYVFMIPVVMPLVMAAFAVGVVCMVIGTMMGLGIGKKISTLIN
ncbi:hypothetical protein [Clostridium sp.]|uniref:hypothetical protein n=1 Tax=Clostridium sp. TaxID=1506 RepID=UPI001A5B75C7|nr:hypothetical protein [Clostridium sp.]MBK5239891.1 hypothetical protein [Clostridium sp.]